MENTLTEADALDRRMAARLRALRAERGWSLDDLAGLSGISRASLSRLENAEVSPTAAVLGRLCAAFGLTLSRLMLMVEGPFAPLLHAADQPLWTDPATGFRRRAVSPPARTLAGEVLDCSLQPGTEIAYDGPPRAGLEHHLVMVEGTLDITVDGQHHVLQSGDCLRYQLQGASLFRSPADQGARYFLFVV